MKHEQATLVFLAYVIGFTSAFIAFALNDKDYDKEEIFTARNSQIEASASKGTYGGVKVVEKEDGLFVVKKGKERIVSAFSDEITEDGFHAEIVSANVSPSGKYVYYCASSLGSNGLCTNFVYSVEEDFVYKVRIEGEILRIAREETDMVSWTSRDALSFVEGQASAESNWIIR